MLGIVAFITIPTTIITTIIIMMAIITPICRQYMSAIFYHTEEQKKEAEASLEARTKLGKVEIK